MTKGKFNIVPLGVMAAEDESNSSSVLLEVSGEEFYVVLDAGTVINGIQIAVKKGSFDHIRKTNEGDASLIGRIAKQKITSYLLSHAHLDHVSGLVLHSDSDTKKNILGIDATIDNLRDHIFNWKIWPNFCDEGFEPLMKQYSYKRLALQQWYPIENTRIQVKCFLLDHCQGYPSTAFLLKHDDDYLLFVGDTGSDLIQGSQNLRLLWQSVAPLVASGQLKVIIAEVTFANQRPEHLLFGHLTPKLLFAELNRLAEVAQMDNLSSVCLIPIHVKPSYKDGFDSVSMVKQELTQANNLGVKIIWPHQGQKIIL